MSFKVLDPVTVPVLRTGQGLRTVQGLFIGQGWCIVPDLAD